MKTIGLIGGMSWESSVVYYQLINRRVKELAGGNHSCKSVMYTVDFDQIVSLQHSGDWNKLNSIMADSALRCEKAGAEAIVLCTNTMHLCKDAIIENISVPFIHIAHATGDAISLWGFQKVGLLGTKFTMEMEFYKKELKDNFGIETIVPEEIDRETVHNIIFKELIKGEIKGESRKKVISIIDKLKESGAEGVILGCTEIPLLIGEKDVDIPIFDTTKIHAYKAVDFALQGMELQPVVIERVVEMSASEVWKNLTDREKMKIWYFDIPDFTVKVGETFSFYEPGGENQFLHRCKVLEVIPEKLLKHTWTHPNHSKGETILSWELEEIADELGEVRTFVRLSHKGIENLSDGGPALCRESYEAGWEEIVKTLSELK